MSRTVNRRVLLGLGMAGAASVAIGSTAVSMASEAPGTPPAPTTPQEASERAAAVFQSESKRVGGTWNAFISVADAAGNLLTSAELGADDLVEAFSVNKIAVALAVLDKIDRGQLTLDQKVDVTADIIVADGDGIFRLDRAHPSSVTLGHVMANLLSVSDDTASRLCGLVVPAKEINEIVAAKGFPKTQVNPSKDNPNRFFLGKTTARETHNLLQGLVKGTLLSKTSTEFLFNILRSPVAFTDGIRRNMSTVERGRVATKAGWFFDGRNEAGIMFDTSNRPVLTYSLFARGQGDDANFAATHPAIEARAVMGRAFLDAIANLGGMAAATVPVQPYRPYNGG